MADMQQRQNAQITDEAATAQVGEATVGGQGTQAPQETQTETLPTGKKALRIVKNIAVWAILAVSVFMMVFTLISSNTFDRRDKSFFGYKFFIVMSDSMKATDFKAGDLVIVKEVDPSTLEEGDIISFISQNSVSFNETVTHKIRRLTTNKDGDPGFVTYGTTTDTDDAEIVTYPFVLGEYKTKLSGVGNFFMFLKKPAGYVVCILLPFAALIIWQGIGLIRTYKQYKTEQTAEQTAALAAEREQVAKEREETQRMMAELNALKAMLLNQNQGNASGTAENGQTPPNTPGGGETSGGQTPTDGTSEK